MVKIEKKVEFSWQSKITIAVAATAAVVCTYVRTYYELNKAYSLLWRQTTTFLNIFAVTYRHRLL